MSGTICISFDTDHMSEARMEEFLRAFQWPGRAVVFCTQRYDCLSSGNHELAPHPFLPEGGDWDTELRAMRGLFPDARGWRSHSCVYSHLLGERAARDGYLYVSTHTGHGVVGQQPIVESWGVVQMPIYYMDNWDFSRPLFWPESNMAALDSRLIERALSGEGLYVFDFHPIHLMLNTPGPDYYMARRQAFIDGQPIDELAYSGRGVATFFRELCQGLTESGRASEALGDVAARSAPIRREPLNVPGRPHAKPRAV